MKHKDNSHALSPVSASTVDSPGRAGLLHGDGVDDRLGGGPVPTSPLSFGNRVKPEWGFAALSTKLVRHRSNDPNTKVGCALYAGQTRR